MLSVAYAVIPVASFIATVIALWDLDPVIALLVAPFSACVSVVLIGLGVELRPRKRPASLGPKVTPAE
ncbi:MAG TPA: hypothetical protein VGU45_17085 [Microvirga sp.]|jgi:hypothetical protein|nr:hypothetical protein [Microvirga sp.]